MERRGEGSAQACTRSHVPVHTFTRPTIPQLTHACTRTPTRVHTHTHIPCTSGAVKSHLLLGAQRLPNSQ